MRKLAIVLAALALIAGFGVMKAEAALSDSIAVTVTLQNISVSVTPDTTWAIGVIAPGSVIVLNPCVATNDGNVSENLTIAVSNSAAWTAGLTAGANVFAMDFGISGGPYGTNITTAGVPLYTGLGVGDSYSFGLEFTAPTSTASFSQQSITVTVSASA